MEIGLLIKNYSDCKCNLECALSYILDEMSCDIDFSSEYYFDYLKNKNMILDFIICDLEHTKRTIEVLKELNEKGV